MAESKAATREQLEELHRLATEAMLEYLTVMPVTEIKASFLAVVVAFLRDNGVTASLSEVRDMRKALGELASLSMPFPTTKQ